MCSINSISLLSTRKFRKNLGNAKKLYLTRVWLFVKQRFGGGWCRHSSVDLSPLSILPPQVWLPSTPSMLLSFKVKCVLYLSLQCGNRTKINEKEAGFGPFFNKVRYYSSNWVQKFNSFNCVVSSIFKLTGTFDFRILIWFKIGLFSWRLTKPRSLFN